MKNTKSALIAMLIGCVVLIASPVFAGKATFSATVSPAEINPSVSPQGIITGNKQVTVSAKRERVGASALCTKIYWLDAVRGGNHADPSLGSLSLGKKGLCYFSKQFLIQPFSDNEISDVCRGVNGGTRRLVSDGLVNAWKHTSDYGGTNYSLEGVKTNRRPNNISQVRFVANVQCGSTPTVTPVQTCDMQGWWKLTTGIAAMDGEWKFTKAAGSSQSLGRYSTKGPATKRGSGLIYGNGFGNATIGGNKAFSWSLNNNLTCTGKINNSCSIVAGQCKGKGFKAPSYPFKLQKSEGPVDTGVNNPAGRPTAPGNTVPQRTAPKKPGTTFNPGPTFP